MMDFFENLNKSLLEEVARLEKELSPKEKIMYNRFKTQTAKILNDDIPNTEKQSLIKELQDKTIKETIQNASNNNK